MRKQYLLSLAVILFLAIGTIGVIFYGRGYRFGFEKGKPDLSGTGLLVATSSPNGAQVFIDNHLIFKKGTSGVAYIEKVVQSGQHGRAGYVSIKEGKVKDVNKVDHPIQLSIAAKGQSKRPSAIFLSIIGIITKRIYSC